MHQTAFLGLDGQREFQRIKFFELQRYSSRISVLGAALAAALWAWDWGIDPLHAAASAPWRLAMAATMLLFPLAITLGASRRALPYLLGTLLLALEWQYMHILTLLDGGALYGLGGFMFFYLALPIICMVFSLREIAAQYALVTALPNLAGAAGAGPPLDLLRLDLLIVPAAATAFACSYLIERVLLELYRVRRQLELAMQQVVLQEKMAALGRFTAGVAHEMNNPTSVAHAGAQSLQDELGQFGQFLLHLAGDDAPEVRSALSVRIDALSACAARMTEATGRMRAIVQDLRSYVRLDEAEIKEVDLAQALTVCVELLRAHCACSAQFDCQLDEAVRIECAPARLNQAFTAILVNACEAAGQRRSAGRVTVRCQRHRQQLHIEFDDNGCGMQAQVAARAFEPFFTTKPVGSGRGLGLSTALGIVQQHGGSIELQSTPGIGTCVTVILPLRAAAGGGRA